MATDKQKLKLIEVIKIMSRPDKAYLLFFTVATLASFVYGMVTTELNGLYLIIGSIFLCCFIRLYLQNRRYLKEMLKRKAEESSTLAPVSPEWEKIRGEINEIRGNLAKDILKNRSLNPQQDLLSDILKKK